MEKRYRIFPRAETGAQNDGAASTVAECKDGGNTLNNLYKRGFIDVCREFINVH